MAALRTEALPDEPVGATGADKFVSRRGGRKSRAPENRRYAGTNMNIDLRAADITPYGNTETLNYGQNGIEQWSRVSSGAIYQQTNEDLRSVTRETTQTGKGVKFSHGMQNLFAPPLAGAAESRLSTVSAPMSSYYS
jgi:hypothetical protein